MTQPNECGDCDYVYEEDCSMEGCQILKAYEEEEKVK